MILARIFNIFFYPNDEQTVGFQRYGVALSKSSSTLQCIANVITDNEDEAVQMLRANLQKHIREDGWEPMHFSWFSFKIRTCEIIDSRFCIQDSIEITEKFNLVGEIK